MVKTNSFSLIFSRVAFLLLIVFSLIAAGCGSGSSSSNPSPTPSASSNADQVLSKSTIVVGQVDGENSVVETTADSVTLKGIHNDVVPGKVLLSNVGTGFLRKVVSASVVNGNTIVQTQQASLEDAFDELHFRYTPAFDKTHIGDIQSAEPGLSFAWVQDTSKKVSKQALPIEYNKLEIGYGDVSVQTSHGITLSGTATLGCSPEFDGDISRAPGDLLPSVSYVYAGFNAQFHGSITVKSKYGGEITAAKPIFDEPIGEPVRVGWLVFVPHLKIEAAVSGTSSGSIDHVQNFDATLTALESYNRGQGWTTTKEFTPTTSATESEVEAEFGVELKPVILTLSFDLYGIAGPYTQLYTGAEAKGTHTVEDGVEGIDAEVERVSGGEIGVNAHTSKAFEELFDVSATFTPIDVPFEIDRALIYSHFFPYPNTSSSIRVGDNGPSPDDVFSVTVDGAGLGQTDKGGTGAFRITSLTPGSHTLTITCLDDGAEGGDVGTLGVTLDNGFTFEDGSTYLSDELQLSETKQYTIIAPTRGVISRKAQPMPKSRVRKEHPK